MVHLIRISYREYAENTEFSHRKMTPRWTIANAQAESFNKSLTKSTRAAKIRRKRLETIHVSIIDTISYDTAKPYSSDTSQSSIWKRIKNHTNERYERYESETIRKR